MRWMRWAAGLVAIAIGLVVIVRGVTAFSPGRASDGDHLIRLVEGELTDQGLADHQFDLSTWDRGSAQLQNETIPYLAQRAGMDAQTFTTRLRQQVPEVDNAITTLPGALPFAHKILDNLARQQDNFRAAEALPGPGISLRTGSWLLLVAGALIVVLGVALVLVDGLAPAIGLAVIGALLLVGPLTVGFASKADKTSDLLGTLNFDKEVAARTRHFFEVTRDLFASVDTKIIPFAASTGHVDSAALTVETHQRFAQLATALDRQREIAARFETRVKIREQAVDRLREVKKAPLRSAAKEVTGAGAFVLAAGLVGAVAAARRRVPVLDADATAPATATG